MKTKFRIAFETEFDYGEIEDDVTLEQLRCIIGNELEMNLSIPIKSLIIRKI